MYHYNIYKQSHLAYPSGVSLSARSIQRLVRCSQCKTLTLDILGSWRQIQPLVHVMLVRGKKIDILSTLGSIVNGLYLYDSYTLVGQYMVGKNTFVGSYYRPVSRRLGLTTNINANFTNLATTVSITNCMCGCFWALIVTYSGSSRLLLHTSHYATGCQSWQ